MTTLRKELKKLSFEYQQYFQWKFPETRYRKELPIKTEAEFLKAVDRKTMNSFLEWEKTPEYTMLVSLYLQSKIGNDLHEIYEVVRQKALTGEDKSVKLLLQLNKEINAIIKETEKMYQVEEEDDDDDLGLSL